MKFQIVAELNKWRNSGILIAVEENGGIVKGWLAPNAMIALSEARAWFSAGNLKVEFFLYRAVSVRAIVFLSVYKDCESL